MSKSTTKIPTKPTKNRAQRRRDKRRQIEHPSPSFWTTTAGKVTVGVLGALVVAFIVWQFWAKTQASSVPAAATTKPAPPTPAPQPAAPAPTPATPPAQPADAGKLEMKDTKVGTGDEAKTGDRVSVHYIGTLTNGTKFESSYDKGAPYTFVLGSGEVIKGWDQGIVGMKVGGKRTLTIPPSLGYGATAHGPIPANATLKFDVELMKVEHQGQ